MAAGGHEVELKLEFDPDRIDALVAACDAMGGEAMERDQTSTYFDTPRQDLRGAGLSLRVRRTGDRYVQTVKADGADTAGLFARPEWEREVAEERLDLDDATPLRALVSDTVLDRIGPAFRVEVRRREWRVIHDGAVVELVIDQGNVLAGDRATPVCELELELSDGSPAALFSLARTLDIATPLRLGVLTKSARGYGLIAALEARAIKARPMCIPPGSSVAEAFAGVVGNCVRQFRLNEELLRAGGGAEALHEARVGLRRLRSALSVFKPVVAAGHFDRMAGELRWIAATLGRARDLDVLGERLGRAHAARLAGVRDGAYADVMGALASHRLRVLMIDLTEWVAVGAWRVEPVDAALVLQPAERFAAMTLDRLCRRVKRRSRDLAALGDQERHALRIQAKKLRYVTGFFASLFTGAKATRRARAFEDALALLQETLGELNDLATAPVTLAGLGIDVDIPAEPDRRATLIAEAVEADEALMDAKRFWR